MTREDQDMCFYCKLFSKDEDCEACEYNPLNRELKIDAEERNGKVEASRRSTMSLAEMAMVK